MGPRGLTANKAPRPFLDGDDFRAVEGEWLACLGQQQGRALQTPIPPSHESVVSKPTTCTHSPRCPSSSLFLKPGKEATLLLEKALLCFPPGSAHQQRWNLAPPPWALQKQQMNQQLPMFTEHFGASSPLLKPTIAVAQCSQGIKDMEGLGECKAQRQVVWPGEHSLASLGPSILVCSKVKGGR